MSTELPNESERWELPKPLQILTVEQLSAIDDEQRELARKVNSPFANVSPAEHDRARAAQLIKEHTVTLASVQTIAKRIGRLRRPTKRQQKELQAALDAIPAISTQLAEGYALTGRFDLAAEVEPDESEHKRYLRIWEAVWRDDSEKCDCPKTNAGHTQSHALLDIWSVKDNQPRVLMRCVGCDFWNVMPVPPNLAFARAQRSTALALVRDLPPEEAKRVLIARGHTTEKLLK